MRKIMLSVIVSALMFSGNATFAKEPVENVNPKRHPNLAAAQKLSRQAYDMIVVAQKANEWDMNGHAQKAKELLEKVNEELKLAAEAANKNREKEAANKNKER
jgi:hypothetical protein